MGSSEFVEQLLQEREELQRQQLHPVSGAETLLENLIDAVASRLELSANEITGGSRRRRVVEAWKVISFIAVRKLGLSLAGVAARLNISKQSILRGAEEGENVLCRKR